MARSQNGRRGDEATGEGGRLGAIILVMDGPFPSGVVTFVMTDVVGSTRLWQEAPVEMDRAIERHAALIAEAVAARGGTIVKARGEGDSTFSVFAKASEAVMAAYDAQVALRREPWVASTPLLVRFALHTGEAVERDGDYLGPVVNRAARLRSIARGGEVILSEATASLIVESLPTSVRLVELGHVQLRDLDRAERVFALDADELETPALGDLRVCVVGPPAIGVRLLGHVQLTIDGDPVDAGGPKERAVLSLLALAGGPLTQERLIDDLWDNRPPASARKTLQTYIWRLRRVLSDDVLISVGASYELRHEAPASDAARFERLLHESADLLDRDDPRAASAALDEALSLWRGDAITGCAPCPALDDHRARLHELRATAQDRQLDAELRLGHHAERIADLESLVQDDHFREERWRMLVLALYRSGRQRDALQMYQRARRTLVEGLGVEPGPALKSLEQAILEQRPELNWNPNADRVIDDERRAPSTIAPPLSSTSLVGRDTERGALAALLTDHRLVTITGPGGAGKTRLTLAIAESDARPVSFCDLSLISRDGSVLHAMARSIGLPLDLPGAQAELDLRQAVVRALHDRDLLLVIDNCEHVLLPASEIVSAVLAECRGVHVLATSREPLGVPGEQVFPLAPLEVPTAEDDIEAGAVTLFAQRAAAAHPGFELNASNQATVVEICRRLEGLPLALELAAARLSHMAPEELLDRLDQPLQVLTARSRVGPDRHRTLQAALDWSHDLLGPSEQALFRRLAVFAGHFDVGDVEACCSAGVAPTAVIDLVRALVDCSLIVVDNSSSTTRYRMLETIRSYALDRLVSGTDEDETRQAHCLCYLARIEGIEWGERVLAVRTRVVLASIQEDLRRALVWSEASGRHDLVARLAASMIGLWKEGHFAEADRWFPVAIDYESSLPPSERTATALSSLMYLFHWDGNPDSLRQHRLRLAALVENLPAGLAITSLAYSTLASLCSRMPGEAEAWESYADLALRHSPTDAPEVQAMARCQKARALMHRDRHREAITVLEDERQVRSSSDLVEFEPREDLALAYHLVGDHQRALEIAESRLSQFTSHRPWYVAIYAALAAAEVGEPARARAHLHDAVMGARSLAMPLIGNDCRLAAGAVAYIEGRTATAVSLLAGLSTGSTSYNTLGVLLRHYQDRVRAAVSAEDWDLARANGVVEWSLIQAELGLETEAHRLDRTI
jgi:predicted ATPase/DNA-binding SARP family transcriptional activator/class 3 adenylate cyclase